MTVNDFADAFNDAARGAVLPYHSGPMQVAEVRSKVHYFKLAGKAPPLGMEEGAAVAEYAWMLYENRQALLVQRRETNGSLTYLAIKR